MQTTGCNSWRGHKWPKWGPIEFNDNVYGIPADAAVAMQRRTCERCGMVELYNVTKWGRREDNDRR